MGANGMTAETTGAGPLQHGRWLAEQADWLAANSRATELGRRARRAYLDRTQMRNLQRVAETTTAVSTLLDYVKTQIGKLPPWRRESFGTMVLDDLERLRTRADQAPGLTSKAHLELCRLFVRQVAASYVYSLAVDAVAPRAAAPAPRPAPAARETSRPPRQRGQRTGETRGPQDTEKAPPAPEQQTSDSEEPEVRDVEASPEAVAAPGETTEAQFTPDRTENEAEAPDQLPPPANNGGAEESAPPDAALARSPEPGEGSPTNEEAK